MTRTIPLTQGKVTIVDELDYAYLTRLCVEWHLSTQNNGPPYAAGYPFGEKGRKVKMHKVIAIRMGLEGLIDHKNRNSLDNTRENLREVLATVSARNRSGWGKSGAKGVYKRDGKFRAAIRVNKHLIQLGTFLTIEEAVQERNWAERIYFGEDQ